MKIKIAEKFYTVISPCNIRRWSLALLRQPGVEEVRGDVYADIGINTKDNVGKSVYVDTSDIQSLVYCYDVDKTVVEEYKQLLSVPYKAPSVVFGRNKSRDLGYVNSWDYYANMISTETMKELLLPHLKETKLLTLYHSLPQDIFYKDNTPKKIDVFFMGAMRPEWYPLREIFHNELRRASDLIYVHSSKCGNKAKAFLTGTPEEKVIQYESQMNDFADYLRLSKIMLVGSSIFNIAVKKYIEGMATGCLILGPMPKDGKQMGFEDGVNMVVVNEKNFMKKVYYYLEHDEERNIIINNAYQLFKERHTCMKSAGAFLKQLK